VYVGVGLNLLEIEMGEVEKAIGRQFAKKGEGREPESGRGGRRDSITRKAQFEKRPKHYFIQRMDQDRAARSSLTATLPPLWAACLQGARWWTWYPITPSSSLGVETMNRLHEEYRIGPGRQSDVRDCCRREDETGRDRLMVIGAGWAGARSMTATAGPGISLMAEFAGLRIRGSARRIWDIQRVGPSTPCRLAPRRAICWLRLSVARRHKHIMLIPCRDRVLQHGPSASDLMRNRFQTLIFVMSDS